MFRIAFMITLLLGAGSATAATVSGGVVDRDTQQPIAGARVDIVVQRGLGSDPRIIASGSSDVDGRYAIDTGTLTDYTIVVASAAGYAPRANDDTPCHASVSCYWRPSQLPLGGDVVVDFALGAGSRISGRVRDADSGLVPANASVWVKNETLQLSASVLMDASGNFSIPNVHAGDYTITATGSRIEGQHSPYLQYQWPDRHCDSIRIYCHDFPPEFLALGVATAVDDIDVRLRQGAYLRTRMLSSATGQPFTHDVRLRMPDGGLTSLLAFDATTGLGPLVPGDLKLELLPRNPQAFRAVVYPDLPCVGDPCDVSAAPVITIPPLATFVADDVHVAPSRSVSGRVTAQFFGEPLAGIPVSVGTVKAGLDWGFSPVKTTLTTASGAYFLEDFSGDDLVVRTTARSAGWIDRAWEDLSCAGYNLFCDHPKAQYRRLSFATQPHALDVDFELRRGASINGRVQSSGGAAVAHGKVAVVPASAHFSTRPVFADANGEFRIDGLPPGEYYLIATNSFPSSPTEGTLYPDVGCHMAAPLELLECDFGSAATVLVGSFAVTGLTITLAPPDSMFADSFD